MASFNQIQILGNVGRVDVKTFGDGGKIVNISVATSETYKDRNGEKAEETQWHNVVMRGSLADVAERYVSKGDPIFIAGPLKYRKYTDRDGIERTIAEVNATSMQLLGRKDGGGSRKDSDDIPDWMR